ncbi:hypothetical protein D3C72_2081100 [compost metagenome]
MGNGGVAKWGGGSISTALSKAVDFYKYGDGKATAEMLEAEAKKEKDAKDGKDAKAKAPAAPAPAPSSSSSSSGQSPSSRGSSGASYVTNINVPGNPVSLKWADERSKTEGEKLITQLLSGKGVSQ